MKKLILLRIARFLTIKLLIFHCNQFSQLKPSTLVKSLSLETTVKPLIIAVAAIKTSLLTLNNLQ